jgi:hypothetical protein
MQLNLGYLPNALETDPVPLLDGERMVVRVQLESFRSA